MSETAGKYNGQPRHDPALQSQVVRLAKLLAAQPDSDLFSLFCAVYYTTRGESANVQHRLRRLAELIAEHPQRAEIWAGLDYEYRQMVARRRPDQ